VTVTITGAVIVNGVRYECEATVTLPEPGAKGQEDDVRTRNRMGP
jgi:hypothetical protein